MYYFILMSMAASRIIWNRSHCIFRMETHKVLLELSGLHDSTERSLPYKICCSWCVPPSSARKAEQKPTLIPSYSHFFDIFQPTLGLQRKKNVINCIRNVVINAQIRTQQAKVSCVQNTWHMVSIKYADLQHHPLVNYLPTFISLFCTANACYFLAYLITSKYKY